MPSPPPGPRSPSFVQTARFLTRPLEFFQEQVDTYGPIFTIHLAGLPTLVMLTSPADLKALFTASAELMHAGAANSLAFGPVAGTRTHFVLDRESHLERRRLMLPPFHGDRMHEYGEAMADVTARAVASWPRDRVFAAHPELQRITLQVILRTILGLDERAPRDEHVIRQLVRLANEALASPLLMARPLQWDLGPWSPWGRVVRVVRESDRLLLAEIQKRRAAGDAAERKDVLSMLLLARNEQGERLTDAEVRDELTTLVLAGHETTGTALAWALECLLQRPAVVRRIREEMAQLAGSGEAPRGREQLAKLEYLDAVVKEVLRFRPIMAFGGTRVLQAPWRLGGWEIPAGAAVANALSMVHRRPDLYPEPHEFRPERFLGRRPDPYEWTPFGGGVRRCLGMAFALYEMKIVLAQLLSTVELELAVSEPVRAVTRGFFIAPKDGLPIRVKPRTEPKSWFGGLPRAPETEKAVHAAWRGRPFAFGGLLGLLRHVERPDHRGMKRAVIVERTRRGDRDRRARAARRDRAGVEAAAVLRRRVRRAVGVVPADLLADLDVRGVRRIGVVAQHSVDVDREDAWRGSRCWRWRRSRSRSGRRRRHRSRSGCRCWCRSGGRGGGWCRRRHGRSCGRRNRVVSAAPERQPHHAARGQGQCDRDAQTTKRHRVLQRLHQPKPPRVDVHAACPAGAL